MKEVSGVTQIVLDRRFSPRAAGRQPSAQAGEKWAVIVGVNDYGENIPHLRYAVADAKRIYGLMTKCTPPDHVVLLASGGPGPPPTRANINQSVANLASRAKPSDEFWFCFSGHGEYQNKVHYLLPSDARVSDYKKTAIDLKRLRDDLTLHCTAQHKILVVDACHSGGDDLIEGRRGVGAGAAPLMVSCRAQESSWELPELGEGVFTWFFLKKQDEIAPNSLSIPNQDDAETINTHVSTFILRNKKPFTQTPQVIGDLPIEGEIPWNPTTNTGGRPTDGHSPVGGPPKMPDPPGTLAARDPLGPAILVDLPDARKQLNGTTVKSDIMQSALRKALLKQNFPLVDLAAARQLETLLNRKSAAAKAKKLGARYLIRGRAETEATKLAITGPFITVQATVTAELIDENGNVLAQAVIGSTEDDEAVGSNIVERSAATVALEDAAQKLTVALLPKLRAALVQPRSAGTD